MPNIATAKEVCKYLKLTESTVYKLASNGELPGFKIGDSWRFDMEEVIKNREEGNHVSEQKIFRVGPKRETGIY